MTATSTAPETLTRTTTSLPQAFLERCAKSPEREAYRYPVGDDWRALTWKQAGERVRAIAAGLQSLGLGREERVAILCATRYEWVLIDLGILCAGGATTTVYPSSTAEECAYILRDSDTRIIFAEDATQLAKLRAHKAELPSLKKVVLVDGAADAGDDWVVTLADLETRGQEHLSGQPDAVTDAVAAIEGEHLATLIYTSGTTGKPKGVRLVHECWAYTADAIAAMGMIREDDLEYLWLPLSHSFGKVLSGGHIRVGHTLAIDGRIPKLVDNLGVVRPAIMAAAPRIFEKVYNKVVQGAKDGGGAKWKIFQWAVGVGKKVSALRQAGKEPGGMLALKHKIAHKLVFSKLHARFGGRLRLFISGSAPLSREIAEFFHACGILIVEGYGLTESSAASFVNRASKFRFGTVGVPLPGCEVKLAPEDNEILLKSPGVMRGYHNLPEETAQTLTPDGWLRTGDIGEVDDGGFLRITDRKKDLIKTSGGKYIAPQHIEGKIKATCPYVSQAIVHGDKRNFVTALVTLDEESIKKWAESGPLAGKSYAEIAAAPETTALVQTYIDQVNAELAKYETIKKFSILPRDLTVEEGELTPSLKVKRKAVEKKYIELLDGMYKGALADA
ncbi:MAG: long-chain fatty acid--CoA ligase [Kofleriaceae bacterium]|nr:MAG: long-chain fatty acid--CoA ligase [Kofleriaceae bacterium]MBZ0235004.1 long-chain fatty acid--CoA ligase [Kofleriaceae bacterium]